MKKFIVIVGILLTVSLGLFAMLFVPMFSNSRFSTIVRHVLFVQIGPKLGLSAPMLMPVDILLLMELIDNTNHHHIGYLYTLMGKFVNLDFSQSTIELVGRSGKTYTYRYSEEVGSDLSYVRKENDVFVTKSYSEEPVQFGELILVQWADDRTLNEILSDSVKGVGVKLVNSPIEDSNLIYSLVVVQ